MCGVGYDVSVGLASEGGGLVVEVGHFLWGSIKKGYHRYTDSGAAGR